MGTVFVRMIDIMAHCCDCLVGFGPTSVKNTKHGRSGHKPVPGFVPESYVIVVHCL